MRMSCVLKKSHFQRYYGNCNEFTCSLPCWAPQPPDSNTVCSDAVLGSDLTVLSVQGWNVNVRANLLSQTSSQWDCVAGRGAEVQILCSQTRKSKMDYVILHSIKMGKGFFFPSFCCVPDAQDYKKKNSTYSCNKIKSSHKIFLHFIIFWVILIRQGQLYISSHCWKRQESFLPQVELRPV